MADHAALVRGLLEADDPVNQIIEQQIANQSCGNVVAFLQSVIEGRTKPETGQKKPVTPNS